MGLPKKMLGDTLEFGERKIKKEDNVGQAKTLPQAKSEEKTHRDVRIPNSELIPALENLKLEDGHEFS